MSRTTLGLLAVGLLAVGGIAAVRGPEDGSASGFAGGCIRVGVVLAALWLALPQIMSFLAKAPRWLLAASGIGAVIGAVKPMLLVLIVPVLALLWLFGPRLSTKADKPLLPQRRPRRRSQS